jgi:F-type H+-transporting ATPase subunit c
MLYLFGLVIASGFAVAVAAFGCGLGQGNAVAGAMEGMARQPENSGQIRTAMIIGLALIESLTIYAFVMSLILMSKLPDTAEIVKIISAGR